MKIPDIQEWDKKKLLQQGDVVKFRILGHPITINEIHTFQMGFVGLFVGLAYSAGLTTEASLVAMTLVGYAILGNPTTARFNSKRREYYPYHMPTSDSPCGGRWMREAATEVFKNQ